MIIDPQDDRDDLPRLMTVREVAAAARLEPGTIRKRVQRGLEPQPVRLGRNVRFRRDDVKRWLNGEG